MGSFVQALAMIVLVLSMVVVVLVVPDWLDRRLSSRDLRRRCLAEVNRRRRVAGDGQDIVADRHAEGQTF